MKSFARAAAIVILAALPGMSGTCLGVSRSPCSVPSFSAQRSSFAMSAPALSPLIGEQADPIPVYVAVSRGRSSSSDDRLTRNLEAAGDLIQTANAALVLDAKSTFSLSNRVAPANDAGLTDALALRGLNGIQAIDNRQILAGAEGPNDSRPSLQPLQDPGTPEPVTAGLVGLGLTLIGIASRRRLAAK